MDMPVIRSGRKPYDHRPSVIVRPLLFYLLRPDGGNVILIADTVAVDQF